MDYVKRQLEMMRRNFLQELADISAEEADVQPEGFNNTIHWHIGHVLTTAEKFLLGFPYTGNLPAEYEKLFGYGSKPSDWTDDVPSMNELKDKLEEQLERLLTIPEERLSEKLEQPFMQFETYGELVSLTVIHEMNHLGQIHAMKRLVKKNA
ncbi:DinB family protein [Bacillus massiliglaciei]|uniref:DinB family protein n=1 Tax=Bacillus massiliglaciei TaxID=1816693 RepID=UPI000A46D5FC|nr:DinB family protein [Bacillus massiliglaciei]